MIQETCRSFVFMFYVKIKPEGGGVGGKEGQENVRRCNVKNRGDTPVQNTGKLYDNAHLSFGVGVSNYRCSVNVQIRTPHHPPTRVQRTPTGVEECFCFCGVSYCVF